MDRRLRRAFGTCDSCVALIPRKAKLRRAALIPPPFFFGAQMANFTAVTLVNLTESEIVQIAEYLNIPQGQSITTAFDGGLMNIQQLLDAGNVTIAKFATYMASQIDPYPLLVDKVRQRLAILENLDGDTSRMQNGKVAGIEGVTYSAMEEFAWHLSKLQSLIPFQVDEAFMNKHTSPVRFVAR